MRSRLTLCCAVQAQPRLLASRTRPARRTRAGGQSTLMMMMSTATLRSLHRPRRRPSRVSGRHLAPQQKVRCTLVEQGGLERGHGAFLYGVVLQEKCVWPFTCIDYTLVHAGCQTSQTKKKTCSRPPPPSRWCSQHRPARLHVPLQLVA